MPLWWFKRRQIYKSNLFYVVDIFFFKQRKLAKEANPKIAIYIYRKKKKYSTKRGGTTPKPSKSKPNLK
jgi:hypothetical protein